MTPNVGPSMQSEWFIKKMDREYVPYDTPKSTKSEKKNPPTIISVVDLENAKLVASPTKPLDMIKAHLQKEKEQLHKKSMESVKNWENTILGQRKKRLMAMAEKERIAEEEKLEIDKQWKLLKSQERNDAIARARHIQFRQLPRVRKLHANLQTCIILHERDKQLEYKQQKKDYVNAIKKREEEIKRREDEEDAREEFERLSEERKRQYLENEEIMRRMEEEYQSHRDLERRLGMQIDKIEIPKAEGIYNFYRNVHSRERKEIEEEKNRLVAKHKQRIEDARAALEKSRHQRDMINAYKASSEKKVLDDSSEFNRMKMRINMKRKEQEHAIIIKRQEQTEVVSKTSEQLEKERESQRQDFIESVASHQTWDPEKAGRERIENQIKRNKEINEYRLQKMAEIEDAKKMEIEANIKERKRIEDNYHEFAQTEHDASQKRHERNIDLRKFHENQHHQKIKKIEQYKQQQALDHNKQNSEQEAETLQFLNYAMELSNEMENSGKDKRPILRVIRADRKEVPPKLKNLEMARSEVGNLKALESANVDYSSVYKAANTWERLGFVTMNP